MVTLLSLASTPECGAAGEAFVAGDKRRAQTLSMLAAGCKKDSLRGEWGVGSGSCDPVRTLAAAGHS